MAVFRASTNLARPVQSFLHAPGRFRGANSGRQKMINSTLSQYAVSMLAALISATILVSAAVGPVGQFI